MRAIMPGDLAPIVEFLRVYIAEHGRSPSQREIAVRFGFQSPGSVSRRFAVLTAAGLVTRVGSGRRSYHPADSPPAAVTIPADRLADLTDRQREIAGWIAGEVSRTGVFPTLREIGAAMGIASPNGVAGQILSLRKKGVIWRLPESRRTVRRYRFAAESAGSR